MIVSRARRSFGATIFPNWAIFPGWRAIIAGAAFVPFLAPLAPAAETTWMIGNEPLTLRSEPWFAGAISSMTYRGVEYLDSADHGRLLSASVAFDHLSECLNPTLGGSVTDGARRDTSSRLLAIAATPTSYSSSTQMAYWMPPGAVHHVNPRTSEVTQNLPQPCANPPAPQNQTTAVNQTVLSDVVYTQKLSPGFQGIPNAILDDVTYTTQTDHAFANVEVVTAYMPKSFDTFVLYDPATRQFSRDDTVDQHPGFQPKPVILATDDGRSALGIIALTHDSPPLYSRNDFPRTTKWNLVYRANSAYLAGSHNYRCVIIIGTIAEVEQAMIRVAANTP